MKSDLILAPNGHAATLEDKSTPPHKGSPWFGWVDAAGDAHTVRLDLIAALARDARTGRYVILLTNCGAAPAMGDRDAARLMQRMGWSFEG
jgi:hypothetical protein